LGFKTLTKTLFFREHDEEVGIGELDDRVSSSRIIVKGYKKQIRIRNSRIQRYRTIKIPAPRPIPPRPEPIRGSRKGAIGGAIGGARGRGPVYSRRNRRKEDKNRRGKDLDFGRKARFHGSRIQRTRTVWIPSPKALLYPVVPPRRAKEGNGKAELNVKGGKEGESRTEEKGKVAIAEDKRRIKGIADDKRRIEYKTRRKDRERKGNKFYAEYSINSFLTGLLSNLTLSKK